MPCVHHGHTSRNAARLKYIHLGDTLAVGSGEGLDSLVYLDAGDDALGFEDVHELSAVGRALEQGLLEHDHAGDVRLNAFSLEEKLAVLAAVFLSVLDVNLGESLSDGSGGLVGG